MKIARKFYALGVLLQAVAAVQELLATTKKGWVATTERPPKTDTILRKKTEFYWAVFCASKTAVLCWPTVCERIIAAKDDIVSVLKFLSASERRVARIDGNSGDMRTIMTHSRDLKSIILRELPSHPRLKQAGERLLLGDDPADAASENETFQHIYT